MLRRKRKKEQQREQKIQKNLNKFLPDRDELSKLDILESSDQMSAEIRRATNDVRTNQNIGNDSELMSMIKMENQRNAFIETKTIIIGEKSRLTDELDKRRAKAKLANEAKKLVKQKRIEVKQAAIKAEETIIESKDRNVNSSSPIDITRIGSFEQSH
ncbi:MAG: hypothetical protein AABY27_02380 [Pseudomonadota bacterium]